MAEKASISRRYGTNSIRIMVGVAVLTLIGSSVGIYSQQYVGSVVSLLAGITAMIVLISRAEERERNRRLQVQIKKITDKLAKNEGEQGSVLAKVCVAETGAAKEKPAQGFVERFGPDYYSLLSITTSRFSWIAQHLQEIEGQLKKSSALLEKTVSERSNKKLYCQESYISEDMFDPVTATSSKDFEQNE